MILGVFYAVGAILGALVLPDALAGELPAWMQTVLLVFMVGGLALEAVVRVEGGRHG